MLTPTSAHNTQLGVGETACVAVTVEDKAIVAGVYVEDGVKVTVGV